MEVKLDKRYAIAADLAQCWTVLRDVRAVAACMPGAQITEQIDATHYKGAVKSKVGPAVMSFGGDIELQALDATTHSIRMLGKGADRAGSSASMQLQAHLEPGDSATQTVLVGVATIVVSGKLAQFGSRLLVPVSDAMLAQFADNFRAAAAKAGAPADALPATAPTTPPTTPSTGADAPAAASAAAASPPSATTAPERQPLDAAAAPANELNALGLLWTVIKGWLAGLFGRRR